ncbi:oligopeptide transport system permease protein [Solimonas aquatica]|uniref:Oligopeptide transport system permease protein n=1 Tax=Solimonas aquatica TaxID=489703 RepID=A0A1H9L7W2_9GAMM|nr:ABC transporter permease subunit [Solimonas aquatica]SER07398.1 oligopeptide transport system permease protein [Solimonas aquatica]
MLNLVLRRLLTGIPTLLLLLTLCFFLMRLAPGGPFDRERSLPPAVETALRAEYHLDESLWQQYRRYLGGIAQGDFGPSFQYEGYRVQELIAAGLPVSLQLGGAALLLALLAGGALAVLAVRKPGGPLDRALMSLTLLGICLPNYVVAPLLVLLFALTLGWLPAGGWQPGQWRDLVLPVAALALPQIAYIARILRSSLLETLAAPYIRAARARGLSESRVLLVHAIKPALLPLISYLGPAAAALLTGSVVIEQVFGIPGLGRYFVQAALNRDYTLVLGVVTLYGALVLLCNLLVDLAYGALDPRQRAA